MCGDDNNVDTYNFSLLNFVLSWLSKSEHQSWSPALDDGARLLSY